MMGSALAQTSSTGTQSTTPAKTHMATTTKRTTTTAKGTPMSLKTEKDKFSYAVGMSIGNSLKQQKVEVDQAILIQGLKDMLAGKTTLLTPEQAQAVLTQMQTAMRQKRDEQMQQLAEVNKKAGNAFLTANTTQAGVVTLPSGLQYKILKAGTGPKPAPSDTVSVNYRGTLIDGKEFDSSAKHGGPATFPVNGVIKGWTEALQLMPVGSKWELFIPPDLAYGDHGAGSDIPPDATLIFEVELLSIKGK